MGTHIHTHGSEQHTCCGHHHHHHHHHGDEEHLGLLAARIILTIVLLAVAIGMERSLTMTTWQELLVYLPAYLLIASGSFTN